MVPYEPGADRASQTDVAVIPESEPTRNPTSHESLHDLASLQLNFIMRTQDKDARIPQLVTWYLSPQRTQKLYNMKRCPIGMLSLASQNILDSLWSADPAFNSFKKQIENGKRAQELLEELPPTAHIARLFLEAVTLKHSGNPTSTNVEESRFEWWQELAECLNQIEPTVGPTSPALSVSAANLTKVRPIVLSGPDSEVLYTTWRDKSKKCLNRNFMDKVINLLLDFEYRNQLVYPFVFLCTPSGTGKSTFAYNLGDEKIPMVYMVYNTDWDDSAQELYRPFKMISTSILKAVRADVVLIKEHHKSLTISDTFKFDTSNVDTKALLTLENFGLQTVDLIVKIYQQLTNIKSQNQDHSWMKAQLNIENLISGEETILNGREFLKKLDRGEPDVPLVMFIDECSIAFTDIDTEGEVDHSSSLCFVYLRSVLRILRIVPFFSGTDATSSNFCTLKTNVGGESGIDQIWCLVLFDLFDFSDKLCKDHICKMKNGRTKLSPVITAISNFLSSIRHYEIPWLVELGFQYLGTLDHDHLASTADTLNDMLLHIFLCFLQRKRTPKDLTKAQLSYLFDYEWTKDGELKSNTWEELCINRHMGFLDAIPYSLGEPYFYLRTDGSSQVYMYPPPPGGAIDLKGANMEFLPSSIFTSFFDSSLAGMVFFGIHSAWTGHHLLQPFVHKHQHQLTRITSFDALLEHYPIPRCEANGDIKAAPSGAFVERLYHASMVVSSRANGSNGSQFKKFAQHFIRELSTTRGATPSARIGTVFNFGPPELTIIGDHEELERKVIPLLSPMSVPNWPQPAIKLLLDASEGECRLGTFQFSKLTETADSLIFEFDISAERDKYVAERASERVASEEFEYGAEGGEIDGCEDMASKFARLLDDSDGVGADFDTEPEKTYGNRGKPFKINGSSIRKIALIGECKQMARDMSLSYLNSMIVTRKFEELRHWDYLKSLKHTECDLFFVLTYTLQDFEQKTSYDVKAIQSMNERNYYVWFLQKDTERPNAYNLKSVSYQAPRKVGAKDVIVMPLVEIWGEPFMTAFIESLTERVDAEEKAIKEQLEKSGADISALQ